MKLKIILSIIFLSIFFAVAIESNSAQAQDPSSYPEPGCYRLVLNVEIRRDVPEKVDCPAIGEITTGVLNNRCYVLSGEGLNADYEEVSCDSSGETSLVPSSNCKVGSFFGLPPWYKYINYGQEIDGNGKYKTDPLTGAPDCGVRINGVGDIWLIVAAGLETLLRVAAMIAVGFIVYGGVTYILSRGAPEKTKQALQTIISAVVGLAISIAATAIVSFIASRFT